MSDNINKRTMISYIIFIIAGVAFGLGCQFPETKICEGLSFLAIVLLAFGSRVSTERIKSKFYIFGMAFSLVAFYWVPQTLEYFGGFDGILAIALFALYCLLSSLQFVFCGFLYLSFERTKLRNYYLSLPLAWLVSEYFWPRLFPWALAHPFISWPAFSSLAEFGGVYPLSAVVLCWGVMVVAMIEGFIKKAKIFNTPFIVVLAVSVILIGVGSARHFQIKNEILTASKIKVGVIQGNLEAKQKVNIKEFAANIGTYRQLSAEAIKKGAELLIWPEAVVEKWTPEGVLSLAGGKFDPVPEITLPFIYGGMTYRLRSQQEVVALTKSDMTAAEKDRLRALYFNSAIFVDNEKTIVGMYHKRILMPFGEYMPLAQIFPFLKKLSPQTGDFNFGDRNQPINLRIKTGSGEQIAKVGNLICYEDLVPRLSFEAQSDGANLLVNLTNDAWYGDSAAPLQHHLLAMWRAIENRRYLIRATNTGYTGIIDPTGETVAALRPFSSGYLVEPVALMKNRTIYSNIGDWPVFLLSMGLLILAVWGRKKIWK